MKRNEECNISIGEHYLLMRNAASSEPSGISLYDVKFEQSAYHLTCICAVDGVVCCPNSPFSSYSSRGRWASLTSSPPYIAFQP